MEIDWQYLTRISFDYYYLHRVGERKACVILEFL